MPTLGIIPARGGSKGVPRKNVRTVADQPLIAYSIRTALASSLLTRFVTSTDDDEIADVALRFGSPVLRRPPELGTDDTPVAAVMLHALEHAERDAGEHFETVVLLQPTSPVRTGSDVDAVITLLQNDAEADCVISVCPMDDVHPARMYHLGDAGRLDPIWPEWESEQRQHLPLVYYRNGALYAVRRDVLIRHRAVIAGSKLAYVMPRAELANIDDERDLMAADVVVRVWKEKVVWDGG